MAEQKPKEMTRAWTKEILLRCTPREILVIVAAYAAEQVAERIGYEDIQKFIQERSSQ